MSRYIEIINKNKYRITFTYFVLLIISMIYTYTNYSVLKNEYNTQINNEIVLHYELYKKIYKTEKLSKDILIENEDYIDNKEIVDEFARSTPLFVEKESKKIPKYKFTIKFYENDILDPNYPKQKVLVLQDREYYIDKKENLFTLFGKVENIGFVYISKNVDNFKLQELVSSIFRDIALFAFVNIGIFLYFLYILKKHNEEKENMDIEYLYLKEDTKRIAFEDRLTGASTRLKFDQTLSDLIDVAKRFEEQRFTLMIFDIDNFKSINDTHGHDYGDIVLKDISKVVKQNIRKSDTFARWGGEEFVILSPMLSLEQSVEFANKLKNLISQIKFEKVNLVTCSFGLVEFKSTDNETRIMKRADELLYKAKENGKNRVEY